jgi:hypothetical protein
VRQTWRSLAEIGFFYSLVSAQAMKPTLAEAIAEFLPFDGLSLSLETLLQEAFSSADPKAY